ncbi:hypothetical protein H9P43_000585 [Blastocladiella emersonii ATCC 22665]|nr:hypothetical protein H9P43_000585 [Blastocladiella emersonii ATCC 22665]
MKHLCLAHRALALSPGPAAARRALGGLQLRWLSASTPARRSLSTLPAWALAEHVPRGAHVAMAMSGGVDSAVCAHILQARGARVTGIYMKNWDAVDETGVCTSDADWAEVRSACRALDMECHRVDFVKEYWGAVFEDVLAAFQDGLTPNPDVFCNKEIKFGALYRRLFVKGAASIPGQPRFDFLATGHYARREPCASEPGQFHLARGLDANKDQSYFLASIDGRVLPQVLFPLAHARKDQVKDLAREIGLAKFANKKESMGICFIGKRKRFGDFLDGYIEQTKGNFVLEDGRVLGPHDGLAKYTIGQNAKIHSQATKYFVARKDRETGDILLVPDRDHPALYSSHVRVEWIRWILPSEEARALAGSPSLSAQIRYRQEPVPCTIEQADAGHYTVRFATPVRAVTPGQVLVLYDGDHCLGCGIQVEG